MLNAEDVYDLDEARIGVITENSAEIILDYAKRLVSSDYLVFRLFILQGAILKSYQ